MSAPQRTGSGPPYARALEAIARVLQARARNHRNQVVAMVAFGSAVLVVSGTARTPAVLAALALLAPLSGVFLARDATIVNRWRCELLASWQRGELGIAALRAAVRAHPRLPQGTLEGMLVAVPAVEDVPAEQAIDPVTRRAAASVIEATHRERLAALQLSVAASMVAVLAVLAAFWLRSWTPLAALLLVTLRSPARAWLRRRGRAAATAELATCRREPEFSEADFARLVASIR